MGFFEILLMGVALAMDACAVAMTNGMSNPKMPTSKTLLIGGFFGFFQFLMPVIGFFITGIVADAFMSVFEKISSWVSFILLAFLGGKMIFDCVKEWRETKRQKEQSFCYDCEDCVLERSLETETDTLTIGKLSLQAIATSIDALAVGVTLQMVAISADGLAMGVWWSTLIIGGTTFLLAVVAVYIGKILGDKLADKATFCGGLVLIAIGVKLLLEGLL